MKLGEVRLRLKQHEQSRSAFRHAVQIVRMRMGYDHIRVSEIQSEIGYLLFEAGDLVAAVNAFADALVVYRSMLVNDEMDTRSKVAMSETLCNIGSIHLERKNFDAAIDCFLEALQVSLVE